ncbi:ABC transporter permease subunit [Bailinhaonella thermotolerans]|nr:ABC transporter permease subunit [Bailinhaonella thermotolerans]
MTVRTPRRLGPPRPGDGGLTGAVRSEWVKFWSVQSTWWTLASGVALMIGGVTIAAVSTRSQHAQGVPEAFTTSAPFVAAQAIGYLVQWCVAVLGVLTITSEYSTGTIRSTLVWVPDRGRVLLAKILVLAPVMLVFGLVLGAGALGLSIVGLGEYGDSYSTDDAYDTVLGIALYLPLLAVFALGLGVLMRGAAGAIAVLFVILLIFPIMLPAVNLAQVAEYLPGDAGAAMMNGGGHGRPLSGLIVLGWTLLSALAAHLWLKRRDIT